MTARPRVVLADDDERSRRVMQAMLRGEDFDLVLAEDGLEALQRLDEAPTDVLVLDVQMPRLDGFATCRRVRAEPRSAACRS